MLRRQEPASGSRSRNSSGVQTMSRGLSPSRRRLFQKRDPTYEVMGLVAATVYKIATIVFVANIVFF